MNLKKENKIAKIVSGILILVILAPSIFLATPKKAEAFWGATWLTDVFTGGTVGTTGATAVATGTSTAVLLKNVAKEILKQIVMTIEKRLLAEMTKSMVNWINSGFHGSPLFLQNPDSFFRDIAKYEIKTLITITGYDPNRFPFGKDMALNTINQFNKKFADNAAYSLSNAIRDPVVLTNLRNNFNFGGWNGFLINTQYPQNNYLGYRMIYTEELARRLEGTANNKAKTVTDTINRGAGFLSPQKCMDNNGNNSYNNGYNEFVRPNFKQPPFNLTPPEYDYDPVDGTRTEKPESIKKRADEAAKWQADEATARTEWNKKNYCKNLVATTPGSVVGNQIMNAMSSNFRQTELGAALGSSMSAIFDALLNKFIGDGLSALASKTNAKPPTDDFEYDGVKLGGPDNTDTNTSWDSGPDEVVILNDFKKLLLGKTELVAKPGMILGVNSDGTTIKAEGGEILTEIGNTGNGTYTPGDIDNTKTELLLMDSEEAGNPGIAQMISLIWPKIRELDMCVPGPDIGWEDRLTDELNRNSKKLQEKTNDSDGEKAAQADLVLKELKFAVALFKDWIKDQMIKTMPNSVVYLDEINKLETLYQESKELTDKRRDKAQALARLISIQDALDSITKQPESGSTEEKDMVNQWKKYKAVRASVSSTTTIEETKKELFTKKDQLKTVGDFATKCKAEKILATSSYQNEQDFFCEAPIKGGYDHETFTHRNDNPQFGAVTHPKIPYVNAKKVYTWRGTLGSIFTFGLGGKHQVDIEIKCSVVYRSNITNYKKDLPGLTPADVVDTPPETAPLGTCTFVGDGNTKDSCETNGGTWDTTTNTCNSYTSTQNNITEENCYVNGGSSWTPDVTTSTSTSGTFGGLSGGGTTVSTPSGTCALQGVPTANVTSENVCTSAGGVWTQNAVNAPAGGRGR